MNLITRHACAKLNLGLEVLGRRDDGFHDLDTIFQEIEWCDALTLRKAPQLTLECEASPIPDEDNLALAAAKALADHLGIPPDAAIHLRKHVPMAAGLGGASSDAAHTLLGLVDLWQVSIAPSDLERIAARLGSDVPFFLTGGTAHGTGTGTTLAPLPTPATAFVVIAPDITIPNKTRELYRRLIPGDWSDGSSVRKQADRLRHGLPLDPTLCVNAFARALREIAPEVGYLHDAARAKSIEGLHLSGAGPSHYLIEPDPERAVSVAASFAAILGDRGSVKLCRPVVRG